MNIVATDSSDAKDAPSPGSLGHASVSIHTARNYMNEHKSRQTIKKNLAQKTHKLNQHISAALSFFLPNFSLKRKHILKKKEKKKRET